MLIAQCSVPKVAIINSFPVAHCYHHYPSPIIHYLSPHYPLPVTPIYLSPGQQSRGLFPPTPLHTDKNSILSLPSYPFHPILSPPPLAFTGHSLFFPFPPHPSIPPDLHRPCLPSLLLTHPAICYSNLHLLSSSKSDLNPSLPFPFLLSYHC